MPNNQNNQNNVQKKNPVVHGPTRLKKKKPVPTTIKEIRTVGRPPRGRPRGRLRVRMPEFSLDASKEQNAKWIILIELIILAVYGIFSTQTGYDIIHGKKPLFNTSAQNWNDFFTPEGKVITVWIIAAIIVMMLTDFIPALTVGTLTIVLLLILLSHGTTLTGFLNNFAQAITLPESSTSSTNKSTNNKNNSNSTTSTK